MQTKLALLLTTSFLVEAFIVNAQVSTLGNSSGNSAHYVGWNSGVTFPLDIKHDAAQPINFFTNNTQRMTILSTGEVGIGITAPAYLLDVNGGMNEV
jgi:uncharacterized membrane protein SpoIIM required for sporulation